MKELKSEVKNEQKVRDVLFLEGDHLQFHISVYEEFNNFFLQSILNMLESRY